MKTKSLKHKQKLYLIASIVLLIAIILITILLFCHIRTIEVVGNEYMTDEEIAAWIQSDRYADNSLYAWQKYNSGKYEMHPNLEAVEVKIKKPWAIEVRVYEKTMVGYVIYEDNLVYFGRDGIVLAIDREQRDGIPPIEGLPVTGASLYKKLPVEDEEIFKALLEATQTMDKLELTANRIVSQDGELYLYFGNACAQVGTSNLENRVNQIPPILEKLGDKKGIIHLEYYQDDGDMVSFEPDVWPAEPAGEAQATDENSETSVEEAEE